MVKTYLAGDSDYCQITGHSGCGEIFVPPLSELVISDVNVWYEDYIHINMYICSIKKYVPNYVPIFRWTLIIAVCLLCVVF